MPPSFRQVSGLTVYAFACGYIQRVELELATSDIRVDLWHEGACFHVRVHDFKGDGRLDWASFDNVGKARIYWKKQVMKHLGYAICAIRRDSRYTVAREFHGGAEPSWVVRFCGEWLDKADTLVGAQLKAYRHLHDHVQTPQPEGA